MKSTSCRLRPRAYPASIKHGSVKRDYSLPQPSMLSTALSTAPASILRV
jgi:hypothetical protein